MRIEQHSERSLRRDGGEFVEEEVGACGILLKENETVTRVNQSRVCRCEILNELTGSECESISNNPKQQLGSRKSGETIKNDGRFFVQDSNGDDPGLLDALLLRRTYSWIVGIKGLLPSNRAKNPAPVLSFELGSLCSCGLNFPTLASLGCC